MSVRALLMAASGASTSAPAYRYWRIYVQTNNGHPNYISIAEIELRGTVGGTDLTTPSTPATESSALVNGATKLVDNDTSTGSVWIGTTTTNQWVRFDMGSATVVAQVAIFPHSNVPDAAPKSFITQGSSDGTNFTDVKSFTNVTGWATSWKTFNL